jgi:thiol-disulfide isomerase/thioredoxin
MAIVSILLAVQCARAEEQFQRPSAKTPAAPPSDEPSPPLAPAPSIASSRVELEPAPGAGQVAPIVRDASDRARADRRILVVYVGATWCEPCRRFHDAAERGELDTKFPRLTLLEFDLDRDRERLAQAGYVSRYVPLFALPATDGVASGLQVEGAIKGEGAVAFIAPRLAELLERSSSD